MKILVSLTALALSLTLLVPAHAGRDHDRDRDRDRGWDRGHHHSHDYRDKGIRFKRDTVRLDLPVHVHGKARMDLKRMIRRQHGINPNHYRLVRVVVRGHDIPRDRRDGFARLRVGDYVSDRVSLDGRTRISAPRAYRHADWRLRVRGGRVHNVRVVLEPRRLDYARRAYRRAGHWNFDRAYTWRW